MSSLNSTLRPGVRLGTYPERQTVDLDWLDRGLQSLLGLVSRPGIIQKIPMQRFLKRVNAHGSDISKLSDAELKARTLELGRQLQQHGLADKTTAEVFALIRETSQRVLGMRHMMYR